LVTVIYFSWFLIGADKNAITSSLIISSIAIFLSHHLFAFIFKLYKKVWEYASIGELLIILKVVTCSILIGAMTQVVMIQQIHFRFLAVTMILHFLLIGGSRFIWRIYRDSVMNKDANTVRTLIIGAVYVGTMFDRLLLYNKVSSLFTVA